MWKKNMLINLNNKPNEINDEIISKQNKHTQNFMISFKKKHRLWIELKSIWAKI